MPTRAHNRGFDRNRLKLFVVILRTRNFRPCPRTHPTNRHYRYIIPHTRTHWRFWGAGGEGEMSARTSFKIPETTRDMLEVCDKNMYRSAVFIFAQKSN